MIHTDINMTPCRAFIAPGGELKIEDKEGDPAEWLKEEATAEDLTEIREKLDVLGVTDE